MRIYDRCFTFLGEDQDEVPQTTSNGEQKEKGTKNGDPNGSKSSDFKGHLNGLYNGLANIMTTTCDLGPDSRSQVAPFAVEKAVHNIMFIKHHMKRQDEFDAVSIFKCALSCWMYPKRIIWVLDTSSSLKILGQSVVRCRYLCCSTAQWQS